MEGSHDHDSQDLEIPDAGQHLGRAGPGRHGPGRRPDRSVCKDGGYVVVWTDNSCTYNPIGSAIVGQRYNSAGNKVGGEVNLSRFGYGDRPRPRSPSCPTATSRSHSSDINSGDNDIYVRIFNPSLDLVRDDIIDTGGTRRSTRRSLPWPTAATSSPIRSAVGTDTHIVARIVSASGVVGGQFDIDNQTEYRNHLRARDAVQRQLRSRSIEDEFSGSLYDNDIKYEIFTPTGTPVPVRPMSPAAVGLGWKPIRTSPHCEMAALSSCGPTPMAPARDIRASILSNDRQPRCLRHFSSTRHTAGAQNEASVVALADGGFLVTWENDNADLVRAQRFDAVGNKIGAEFTVKNGVSPWTARTPPCYAMAASLLPSATSRPATPT